jgi:hypothetical protein
MLYEIIFVIVNLYVFEKIWKNIVLKNLEYFTYSSWVIFHFWNIINNYFIDRLCKGIEKLYDK